MELEKNKMDHIQYITEIAYNTASKWNISFYYSKETLKNVRADIQFDHQRASLFFDCFFHQNNNCASN